LLPQGESVAQHLTFSTAGGRIVDWEVQFRDGVAFERLGISYQSLVVTWEETGAETTITW
jgi:hypothetical protein